VVQQWCSRCHSDTASTPQSPYFASSNLATAYAAAQPEISLNTPMSSVFYLRLAQQSHNCWGNPVNCPASAATMLAAIQAFANDIQVTPVDPTLIVSKALTLYQGTVASGADRYDAHDIAKWEFKEGTGSIAYDTSGVDPGMDLTLSGDAAWVGGWGISFTTNGRAQASTATSTKLYNKLIRQWSVQPRGLGQRGQRGADQGRHHQLLGRRYAAQLHAGAERVPVQPVRPQQRE
jgi:hypothetical protein